MEKKLSNFQKRKQNSAELLIKIKEELMVNAEELRIALSLAIIWGKKEGFKPIKSYLAVDVRQIQLALKNGGTDEPSAINFHFLTILNIYRPYVDIFVETLKTLKRHKEN